LCDYDKRVKIKCESIIKRSNYNIIINIEVKATTSARKNYALKEEIMLHSYFIVKILKKTTRILEYSIRYQDEKVLNV